MSERKIGRYIIKGLLGEGAMGSVLKAFDPNLDRLVAVKTMRTGNMKNKSDYAEFKERFFLEARANGRLNHPNITAVYDSGLMDDEPYLVMEYIQGQLLDVFVDENYDTRLSFFINLLEQIAAGLDFAHEEGVIHRDVKPGNVFVVTKGKKLRVKLLDFGLAKLKDSKLTATGYFLGTPSYSSPEQVMGGKLDIYSDLFSFGTMAYEMLTGYLPFDGETLHSILYRIAHDPPNFRFDAFADYLDMHALQEVFSTMLNKKPERRFDSAAEFVEELKGLTAHLDNTDIPLELLQKRGKKKTTRRHKAPARSDNDEARMDDQSEAPTILSKPPSVSKEHSAEVREARNQFRMAYDTGNLSSVRYCLQELRNLGVEVKAEEAQLLKLEDGLRERAAMDRDKRRTQMIREARDEFALALKTRNPDSVRYCLKELRKLNADVEHEKQLFMKLQREIKLEAEERDRALAAAQEVEDLRWSFQRRMDQQDIEGCKAVLHRLLEMDAEVTVEQRGLTRLQEEAARVAQERDGYIRRTREQFQEAVEAEDGSRCRRLITELESLLKVDASPEKTALAALEKRLVERSIREQNEEQIHEVRRLFNEALKEESVEACVERLKTLKNLKADVAQETRALARLRKKLTGGGAGLKERLIKTARQNFANALDRRHIEGCRYYLRELAQVADDTSAEEQQLAELEAARNAETADKIRAAIVSKHRDEFRKAAMHRNLENCRYYIRELKQLNELVDEEETTVRHIENTLKAEDELQQNMIVQSRERFQMAYVSGDATQCEHYLNVLHELGAYTNEEQVALAELKQRGAALDDDSKDAMVARFRTRFEEAFQDGNQESCRFYLGELEHLHADVKRETRKLKTLY